MIQKTKRALSWTSLFAAVAFLAVPGATAQTGGRVMVLSGGTLIDGRGGAPVTDVVVVVQGNRITAVGKRGQVRIPAGANVIKTDGRTILPGLIDSHTHTQEWNIPMFLHYGVTSFQDKYIDTGWNMAEREALATGAMKGPRMFNAGQNLSGAMTAGDVHPALTVEDAHNFAKGLIANHVDIINVTQDLSFDQLRAVVEEAKAAGIAVLGHTQNLRIAGAMGYRHQEHTWSIATAYIDPLGKTNMGLNRSGFDPEILMDPKVYPFGPLIELIKNQVFMNPTLVGQWLTQGKRFDQYAADAAKLADDPGLAFVPEDVREKTWRHYPNNRHNGYANVAEFLKEYVDAGGKVSIGTDSGLRVIPGLSVHYEMQMFVDLGVPPMKALQAATLWNAQLIMKDKDIGSVEVGKLADFTIIEGDPLADIANTRNVRMVIKDGVVQDTKYDPKWTNYIPAPGNDFDSPPPQIAKITPVAAHQNGQTVTITVEQGAAEPGDRFGDAKSFRPNSIVRFDNVDLPTTFVSGAKLTAVLDASLLKRSAGYYPLYVVSKGLHSMISSPAYMVIDTADAPITAAPVALRPYGLTAPKLIGPIPRMALQGSGTVNLTIEGTRFTNKSILKFDNEDLPTTFVSPTKLTAVLDAKYLQRPVGSYLLYVLTPGAYGIVSKRANFMILPKNSKVTWNYVAD